MVGETYDTCRHKATCPGARVRRMMHRARLDRKCMRLVKNRVQFALNIQDGCECLLSVAW